MNMDIMEIMDIMKKCILLTNFLAFFKLKNKMITNK